MRSGIGGRVAGIFLAVAGCGGAPTPPGDPVSPRAHGSASSEVGSTSATAKKLQGTWEIIKYTSEKPIPNEAMPLMGDLFDVLRLRFEGTSAVTKAGKAPEERSTFEIADEQGAEFKMIAKGGMFDGARCKFLDADRWEVTDQGSTWPGVSVLKRVK